jgi:DGQHR domain-containing protein
MATKRETITVTGIRYKQGQSHDLFMFVLDAKQIGRFASVSRICRGEGGKVEGYQRPEVLSHIRDITQYIESDDPMVPNALVIAFDDRVKMKPVLKGSDIVVIHLPVDAEDPAGWIVDGQQRTAAIREAAVDSFPMAVVGFVARDANEERGQFIRLNNTKPLPTNLINELLPGTDGDMPGRFAAKRLPAVLVDRLNTDADSPFRVTSADGRPWALIKTVTNPDGIVKDNVVMQAISNSLSDGVLFAYREADGQPADVEGMVTILKRYWTAVAQVFGEAWGLPLNKSRLFHSAGFVAMSFIMDAVADGEDIADLTVKRFVSEIEPLKKHCRWTEGVWDFGPDGRRPWDSLEGTAKSTRTLSAYLSRKYTESKKKAAKKSA